MHDKVFDAILEENPSALKEAVFTILYSKLQESIETEKVTRANELFNLLSDEEESIEEDVVDEEETIEEGKGFSKAAKSALGAAAGQVAGTVGGVGAGLAGGAALGGPAGAVAGGVIGGSAGAVLGARKGATLGHGKKKKTNKEELEHYSSMLDISEEELLSLTFDEFDELLERTARDKAKSGATFGSLAGPLGAAFGAYAGSESGDDPKKKKTKKEEMAHMTLGDYLNQLSEEDIEEGPIDWYRDKKATRAARYMAKHRARKRRKSMKEEDSKEDFKPHMMYDPKTGEGHKADTYEDHLRMKKMGYTHTKPETKEEGYGYGKKKMKEELKGGQKKLDKNKDGKISGDDFAMMRKGK